MVETIEHDIDTATWLAYERTRESYERSIQAWIRTGTSLITFGFSVYKFFQIENPSPKTSLLVGPREFGAALVILGLVSLILATLQYRQHIRRLIRRYPGSKETSISVGVAAALAGLGIIALIVMFIRG